MLDFKNYDCKKMLLFKKVSGGCYLKFSIIKILIDNVSNRIQELHKLHKVKDLNIKH